MFFLHSKAFLGEQGRLHMFQKWLDRAGNGDRLVLWQIPRGWGDGTHVWCEPTACAKGRGTRALLSACPAQVGRIGRGCSEA